MRDLIILLCAIVLGCTFPNSDASAQTRTTKTEQLGKSAKKIRKKNTGHFLQFNNLFTEPYYYETKELKQIKRLEKLGDDAALMAALEDYVSHFGVKNFGQDYELMWKLAQLYEKSGQMDKAKWMYRLLLKHSEHDIQLIAQYYSDLTVNDKNYYIPIKYYYELVEYRSQVDTLRPPRGVFINMGDSVNSNYEDYGPSLSTNDSVLFFGTKRNRRVIRSEEFINEDIYQSKRSSEDGWTEASPLEGVNTQYNEGAPCLSRDAKTLYFVRCDAPEVEGRCDIFQSRRMSDGTWSEARSLGLNINSDHWDSHPALSHSGDTLFFVSDRPGGFGSNDIFFSIKDKRGNWTPAKNMGPMINSRGNDASPFYHPRYNVLYFSSNFHILNFGNFDIYKSRLVDGKWQEPKNIGPLVNTWGDEHFFTIDSESKSLYYAKSDGDNFVKVDLFSFPLPMEAQPTANTTFRGELVDSVTQTPVQGIVSVIDLDNGIEVAPKYIRPDGTFEFDLIPDSRYLLIIQGDDFFRIEKEISLDGDTTISFSIPPVDFARLQFESVEFASSSAEILPEMVSDLNKLMNFMLDNPGVTLNISGHTDSKGDKKQNLRLSQKRANAIKEYLVKNGGIDSDRIKAVGYGDTKPIIETEETEEDRSINRRVEFEITRPGEEEDVARFR